ncbi:DinB family protein [Ornithinimicrobium sp. F0845]|uniref:DinB family protein n=1 Tax=Ornithinimicrobium sp. F0845 TaxID=2926412 RepID=UPI001FF13DA7|nr:DinB family protein [Ornithinimicrobium sp. F0845]
MAFYTADERAVLEGFVDTQREAIATLLDGLSEEEARRRLVPSLTTPLGLVTHATYVEKVWFHHRVQGLSRVEVGIPETVDESFLVTDEHTIASVLQDYRAACEESRRIASAHELDAQFSGPHGRLSLRYLYGHLIAELARHAGHGDILVEQLRAAR